MKKFISMAVLMVWTISVTSAFADQSADSPADLQELSSLQKVYQQNQAQKKLLQRSIAQASAEGRQCSADQSAAAYTKPNDPSTAVGGFIPALDNPAGTGSAGRTFEAPAFNLFDNQKQ